MACFVDWQVGLEKHLQVCGAPSVLLGFCLMTPSGLSNSRSVPCSIENAVGPQHVSLWTSAKEMMLLHKARIKEKRLF